MRFTQFLVLLFLPILLFSCESVLDKSDPLFYQMSTSDSLKYSKELHQLLKQEALEYFEEQQRIRNSGMCNDLPPYREGDILSIELSNDGMHVIEGEKNTNDLSNIVFEFFTKNRNRTDDVYLVSDAEVLKFPFYNLVTIHKMRALVSNRKQDLTDIKNVEGADPLLIEFYAEKVKFTKERLDFFEIFKSDTLAFMDGYIFVEIKQTDSKTVYNEALDEVINGYFQLRNYECLRYFGESYLSLFGRAKNRKRQIDLDRLVALKLFRPIQIKDFAMTYRAIPPPPEPN